MRGTIVVAWLGLALALAACGDNETSRFPDIEPEPCGDGVLDPDSGEECDDDNVAFGDGCSSTCQLEAGCGDGLVDAGEDCDDDNLASGDGCSATCRREGTAAPNFP